MDERERLGKIAHDVAMRNSGHRWEDLAESQRATYIEAAAAVAADVRKRVIEDWCARVLDTTAEGAAAEVEPAPVVPPELLRMSPEQRRKFRDAFNAPMTSDVIDSLRGYVSPEHRDTPAKVIAYARNDILEDAARECDAETRACESHLRACEAVGQKHVIQHKAGKRIAEMCAHRIRRLKLRDVSPTPAKGEP